MTGQRTIFSVVRQLLDAVPDNEPQREDFLTMIRSLENRGRYVAPEAQDTQWLYLMDILSRCFPPEHRLYPRMSRIFSGDA